VSVEVQPWYGKALPVILMNMHLPWPLHSSVLLDKHDFMYCWQTPEVEQYPYEQSSSVEHAGCVATASAETEASLTPVELSCRLPAFFFLQGELENPKIPVNPLKHDPQVLVLVVHGDRFKVEQDGALLQSTTLSIAAAKEITLVTLSLSPNDSEDESLLSKLVDRACVALKDEDEDEVGMVTVAFADPFAVAP